VFRVWIEGGFGLKVNGKVLIVGCGNRLLGDDGFGPSAAERCRRFKLGDSILAMDVGTQLSPLIMELIYSEEKPKGLIILDASDGGRAPGTVFQLSVDDLEGRSTDTFSLHDFPSPAVFRELRDGRGVEVRIISCQPATGLDGVKMSLSPEVEASVGEAARTAVMMAREMLARSRPSRSGSGRRS
jgi:coenzyme F420 hydrogenase subunit delta